MANLGEELLDLLEVIDVVEFREVMSEKWEGDFDVAIVEGSITDAHGAERIKKIRERCKVLIAYGSCATIGGGDGIKNGFDLGGVGENVYGST